MHDAAFSFVRRVAAMLGPRKAVAELGSRDVNGSVRPLFASAPVYVGVDAAAGRGVDVVADAATWDGGGSAGRFDTVITCETLEHARDAAGVCANALRLLAPGGVLVVTAAAPPRDPHSAADGGPLRPGEWYENVREGDLRAWLAGFAVVMVDTFTNVTDVYALAVKGG